MRLTEFIIYLLSGVSRIKISWKSSCKSFPQNALVPKLSLAGVWVKGVFLWITHNPWRHNALEMPFRKERRIGTHVLHVLKSTPYGILGGMIRLEEITVPGCVECARFKKFWEEIKGQFPSVEFHEIDATTPEGMDMVQKHMVFASPGIIINGELFSTGGVNKDKFIARLKKLCGA